MSAVEVGGAFCGGLVPVRLPAFRPNAGLHLCVRCPLRAPCRMDSACVGGRECVCTRAAGRRGRGKPGPQTSRAPLPEPHLLGACPEGTGGT